MRGRRDHWSKELASTVALALLVAGVVAAQQDPAAPPKKGAQPPAGNEKDKGKVPTSKKGRLLKAPGKIPAKGMPRGGDGLANAANADGTPILPGQPAPAPGTFHYRFRIAVGEVGPLSAAYYPSKTSGGLTGNTSPVVLLVHERERSSKDFEEPIVELKKWTFAEELQKQGYAVLAVDYRGHGASTPRRSLTKAEWPPVSDDLQAAYFCLVDRHNRNELNVAKLGVVALGEGANVAATWAAQGRGVSSEGRATDLGALVLISPMVDALAQGLPAKSAIAAVAARIPIALLAGERDASSNALVDDGPASAKAVVKRYPANKVETFPSALHGYKLLQFEPNMTNSVFQFLDGSIKVKTYEWDGRYLMNPVTYTDVKMIRNPVRVDPAAPAKKAN